MSVLVLVEHDNQSMHPSTKNTLAAALKLDEKPTFVVIGSSCQAVADEVATLAGVGTVWLVDDSQCQHPLAESIADILFSLSESFDTFIAPASTYGKNSLPRLAAKLDVAQVSDVTAILDQNTFEHPVYAGNAIETLRVLDAKKVLTVRTTAFNAITETQPACCIEHLEKTCQAKAVKYLGQQLSVSERPDLGSANIIVSGGRGLQSAEKFKLIEDLADSLGAAVGASRAAVDAGFVPNDYQVGQTGKVVAPTLYIAVGISGAIQHLAGMKDSKVIVAINKDEDAPIFQIADYGLVGDLFELVPQLIEQLKQAG